MTAGESLAQPATARGDRPRGAGVWSYVQNELLYLAWAVMEVALIAPVALAAMPWARYWSPFIFALWILLVMFVPFHLNRIMSLADVPVRRQQRWALLALLFTILFSLRTLLFETSSLLDFSWVRLLYTHFAEAHNPFWSRDVTLFLLVGLVWWRGLSLTNRRVEIRDVGLRLRVGGLILVPIMIALSSLPRAIPSTSFMLLFFLAGLTAVALTRAEQIGIERAGRPYAMRPRWVSTIFLTSLLIVSSAGVLALAVSGQGLQLLVAWLRPVWDALFFFGTVVVTTVTYLALFILAPLEWLLRRLFALIGPVQLELPQLEEPLPTAGDTDVEQLFQLLMNSNSSYLFWVNRAITALIIGGILLLLYLALERFFRRRRLISSRHEMPAAAHGEEDEAPVSLGRRLLQRLGFWRQWQAAASIRRLYRQMCDAASARGYARLPFQTPYEYLETLGEAWPSGTAESRMITEAYVNVRYGELPETTEELEEIRAAWRRLETQIEDEE